MNDARPRLSVVLGTYNRLDNLRVCLRSIFEQTTTPTRVYVTDAGSTDGTIEYLRSVASDRLVPILVGKKLGQARAYNAVFETLDTPFTCWLSDDNAVVNRGLDVGVQILDRLPWVGMVGLKVKDVEGPSVEAPYLGAVSSIGVLNVNQGLLRTSVLQQVGGFSERFRDYGIDPDLTAKVLFSGHDIAYTRAVAVHHYRAWADGSEASARQRERQRTYVDLYWQKWGAFAPPDRACKARLAAWKVFQKAFRMHVNSSRVILGMNGRDWCNVLT
ncbi:MAG: glycosyltransferase, partial [Chloroflexota bacterium]|nr:glycosyltransferase [Chloroflexota bacterium]